MVNFIYINSSNKSSYRVDYMQGTAHHPVFFSTLYFYRGW